MTMRRVFLGLLLAVGAIAASAAPASAQPVCNLAGEHLMSWPTDNPVWQFCWMRPPDSSGTNGSGLEIRNVYYNGHLVMKRGHIPMLNVEYVQKSCGCDCYRDWEDQQDYFSADNIVTPHVYAEPSTPAVTVCDVGGGNDVCSIGQPNCFDGVAAEKFADPLVLTTQFEAGWYRYTMRWKFYMDGRIQPVMGFSAVSAGCVSCTHKHHAYWRFDFDVDGASNIVTEGPDSGAPPPPPGSRPGPRPRGVTLTTETMRLNDYPGISWLVTNPASRRSYRLVPGYEAGLLADDFSEGDLWALRYHASEIDDGHGLGDCPVDIAPWLNGESLSGDVVLWYRSGWNHIGGDLADCDPVGPTLYPVGDWSP
jgi:Copper amine oxidase, enzyme domain